MFLTAIFLVLPLLILAFIAVGWVGSGFDILFTTCELGSFKFAETGSNIRVIENVNTHHLDEYGRFRLGEKELSLLERWPGISWLGLWPTTKVKEIDWEWVQYKQEADQYVITPRKKPIKEFKFQYTYGVKIKNVEIIGDTLIDVEMGVMVWFLDPTHALIDNAQFLNLFIPTIVGDTRAFCANKEFDYLKELQTAGNKVSDLTLYLLAGNGIYISREGDPDYSNVDPNGHFGQYGIAIRTITLEKLDEVGDAAPARRKKKENQLKGEADIEAANKAAEKLRIDTEAAAEARLTEARSIAEATRIKTEAEEDRMHRLGRALQGNPELATVMAMENVPGLQVLGGDALVSLGGQSTPQPTRRP